DEQTDGGVVDVRIEHLAVTEGPVDGVERHGRVLGLREHGFGGFGPVHDAALEDAGLPPLLGKERVGVTKKVEGRIGRDVLHWAFHRASPASSNGQASCYGYCKAYSIVDLQLYRRPGRHRGDEATVDPYVLARDPAGVGRPEERNHGRDFVDACVPTDGGAAHVENLLAHGLLEIGQDRRLD